MTNDDIENRFTYHTPTGTKGETFEKLRAGAKILALIMNDRIPESREKSLAITKLEESIMWANAAVARYDETT